MNKLMARIFAVVMVVVMLGTVSFAATLTDYAAPDAEGYAAQATKTVLAFATNTANATAPADGDVIIAIEQVNGDAPTTLNIDEKKIEGKNYIAIIFSGTNGVKDYAYIDNRDKDVTVGTVTIEDSYTAADGTVYENVAIASFSFNADADRKVVEYGFRFKKDGGSGEGAELKQAVNATMNGAVAFSAAIVAVPEDVTLIATPYILYE